MAGGGGDGDRGAADEEKRQEKIAKKERAAANKLEKQRRSALAKEGLALDSEVRYLPPLFWLIIVDYAVFIHMMRM